MLNARRYHGATTPPKEPYHDVDSLTSAIDGMNLQGQEGHRHSDASSNGSIQAEQTELQKELDLIFEKQAREKLDNVPTYEMPPQFRPGLNLFEHQVEGIRWLVHQERNGGAEASTPRKRPKGSILADDMGLGKTLQTVGLILSNPPKNRVYEPKTVRKPLAPIDHSSEPVCTLIVCPVSVMSNWIEQIDSHVQEGTLRAEIYAGANRESLIPKIKSNKLDVVIVSYDTLRSDFNNVPNDSGANEGKKAKGKKKKKNSKATLFDAKYHRLILDEAQTIRSNTTGFFKSTSALEASKKLCLTGTPFVNRPDDIYSLLSFLELEPLNNKQFFRDYITLPIQRGNKNIGLSRLRLAMSQITLRRTKKVANINMVGKEYHLRRVDFVEGDHKNIHDVLYYTAQVTFDAVVREADYDEPEGTPLTAMFEMVLRVRQACCSGELIPKERYIRAAEIAADLQTRDGKISATEGFRLLNALQGIAVEVEDDDGEFLANDNEIENETDEEEEKNEQPGVESVLVGRPKRQAARDHFLYKRSKSNDEENLDSDTDSDDEVAIKDDSTDSEVSFGSFNEDDSDEELSSDVEPTPKKKPAKKRVKALTCNITQTAPKIDALLATIDEMKPEEKGVIFSQFTTFLNRVEKELWAKGHSFTRIDGSMNAASRIEAIKEFSKEDVTDSPRFILCSLRAAGTGINLTRGNVAFMLDPWWNQAVSAQAMDRVHRIGQTRKVRVYSFVMKDSIEEHMVALTKAKVALGKGSMEKLSPKEECRAKLTAMKDLFEICDIDDCIDSDDDFDGPSFFDEQDKDESYHEESGDEPENFARDSLDSVSLDESSDNSTATPELSSDEEELVDDELSNDSDDDSWFHQNSTFRS